MSQIPQATDSPSDASPPFLVVLGIAQDAGYPQAGCRRACCAPAWADPSLRRSAASVAVVEPALGARWLIDATPDFKAQLRALDALAPPGDSPGPAIAGILLTHGHIGHYTGLIHLGPEALGATGVPVFAMPRLLELLARHEPWASLVRGGTIVLRALAADTPRRLGPRVSATPILVPHRDELSETVGFLIDGPERRAIYIPDIDRWEAWDRRLEDVVAGVDVAYFDGTFFADGELPGRDMRDVPHPTIRETMARLETQPAAVRARVRFVHLNHTNPAMIAGSDAATAIARAGFRIAAEGERVDL